MYNQVGKQRASQLEEGDTSRIREFLRMSPPSFTGSSPSYDPKNFVEKLNKVFDTMHVYDIEMVELDVCHLKNLGLVRSEKGGKG